MTRKKIELNLVILTDEDYSAENPIEHLHKQIAQAVFHLMAIFNHVRTSAQIYEADAEGELKRFLTDLPRSSEYGYSLANLIWSLSEDFYEFQKEPPPEKTIAEMISFLITSESVPEPISNGVSQAMVVFFNEHIDQTEFTEENDSPEHIERLLRAYKHKDETENL